MTDTKTHIHYFDSLRLIAAVSVIFMHVAAGPLRAGMGTDWELINIATSFAFTAVPIFLMMSGYLVLSSPKTASISVLLKKRLPRLAVPLAFWTAVAIIWTLYSQKSLTPAAFISRAVDALNQPAAVHLWYMYTLIAIYALSPLLYGAIHSLDRSGHIYVLVLILLVSAQAIAQSLLPGSYAKLVNIDLINKLQIFGGYLCTFILGYYLGSAKTNISNKILIPTAVLLLAVIAFGTHTLSSRSGEYVSTFQRQSAGYELLLASCLFLLFKQNFNKPCAFFKAFRIVPLLFSVYLMHNILLSMFYAVGISPAGFVGTLGVTLLNFIICLLSLKTAATVKPLCFIVTGLRYDDACRSCNWIYTFRRNKNGAE